MTPFEHLDALSAAMVETAPIEQVEAAWLHFQLLRLDTDVRSHSDLREAVQKLEGSLTSFERALRSGIPISSRGLRRHIDTIRYLLGHNSHTDDERRVEAIFHDLEQTLAASEDRSSSTAGRQHDNGQ